MNSVIKYILKRKITSGTIALALIVSGYFGYAKIFSNNEVVRFVTATVDKGTLIVSVSGSGQTSAFNQVDIKSKVPGDIVFAGIKNKQEMMVGTLIAQIDSKDAQKAMRDAEANLESAKLSLEKLKKPADRLSILQSENAIANAVESKQKAENDLKKAREDGFNTVANAFLDLPSIMTGLYDMLFGSTLRESQWNVDYYADSIKTYDEKILRYKENALAIYQTARVAYDQSFDNYKSISRFSDLNKIESLINETYDTTKNIAEAVKNVNNFIQFYKDKMTERNLKPNPLADTYLSTLNAYTGKTNIHLLNIFSIKNTLQTGKETIGGAGRTIAEKTETLAKLNGGADELDIQLQELAVKQRENALLDAKEKLADYFILAPFSGVVAKINAQKGDSTTVGAIIATLITKQRVAEISLNEVDVSKIKVGQKVTATFDAIEGLSITGEVTEIDSVGTVSQGVVTYGIKIGFDTQDGRVKPGMSVSAAIITDVKQNVLLVPNSAVKQQNNTMYVEMFVGETQTPRQQTVQTGLSNDTTTEIVSGLNEGDKVVTQTITTKTSQSQTQQNTGIRIPGLGGGGSRGVGGFGR